MNAKLVRILRRKFREEKQRELKEPLYNIKGQVVVVNEWRQYKKEYAKDC